MPWLGLKSAQNIEYVWYVSNAQNPNAGSKSGRCRKLASNLRLEYCANSTFQPWVDRFHKKSCSIWWAKTLASDYDSIQLEDIEHVWYFEPILEHILFLFVTHLLATRCMFLHEFVIFGTMWMAGLTHLEYESESDMWPSIVTHTRNLCYAFNPSNVHTLSSEHTHTLWTHTQSSGQPFMLRCPGSSWGFGALLKGTSVVVLKVEESTVDSFPPPTIPAVPGTRTRSLWVTSPTLTIRPRLPQNMASIRIWWPVPILASVWCLMFSDLFRCSVFQP